MSHVQQKSRAGAESAAQPVRDWPPRVEMSSEMIDQVKERWEDYGFGL